ncbi:MAG: hypothetical protein AB1599_06460 [Planctomycetota bacterium]
MHPFKDEVVSSGDYDFYVTMADLAPNTVDLTIYIENSLLKRPVRSASEIWLSTDDSPATQRFVLQPDYTGASTLRYFYDKPVRAKLKIATTIADSKPISAETSIQIGSPKPSYLFFIIFVASILFAVAFVCLKRGFRS